MSWADVCYYICGFTFIVWSTGEQRSSALPLFWFTNKRLLKIFYHILVVMTMLQHLPRKPTRRELLWRPCFVRLLMHAPQLDLLSFFMIKLCLVEYEMLKFPPSLLAAATIFTTQCIISGSKQWTKTSEWHSSYSEELLLECSSLMVTFHQKAGTGKLTGVHPP